MSPDLICAMHEFADMFEVRGYRYAIMGGIAARVLGIPRPTYDVDFALAVSRDLLPELFDAAESAGRGNARPSPFRRPRTAFLPGSA